MAFMGSPSVTLVIGRIDKVEQSGNKGVDMVLSQKEEVTEQANSGHGLRDRKTFIHSLQRLLPLNQNSNYH